MELPILVVEDSQDDIMLLKHAWKKAGLVVPLTFVYDGAQAIEYLRQASDGGHETSPMPKLMLTDLKMPRVNGFELLEFLKQDPAFNSIVPLVWSSSTEMHDLRKAHVLGARCYFPKPFDDQSWKALVQTIMTFYNA